MEAIKLFILNFGTKIGLRFQLNYSLMKNFYIALVICLSFFQLQAQKVDYDNTSKWFMGFNIGGTWNTTDVKNQTSTGWGVVLGKSFNYNYGSAISFDLRGRYLRGNWYGQDTDTTSLLNYSGSALTEYKDQYGYTVNNFQSDVHIVALELVLHLNRLRDRTGWDPYVFGGAGFTFKQTYGDLLDQNGIGGIYDYSSMLANGPLSPQLSSNLDKIYDSPLDGSTDKYQAYFMPSLGFGLGYQIGKRVSLGIEHKTTFTLRDDFDGFVSTTPRLKNDLYHYTSMYLNFRFKTRGNGNTTTTDGTNSTGNIDNFNTNCPTPIITINSQTNQVVNFAQFKLEASATDLQNAQNLTVLNNLNQVVPSNYNSVTKRITADILLVEGVNILTIKAQNNCGTDTKTITITYNPCVSSKITFTNPVQGTTVRNFNFTVNAIINNVPNVSGIRFYENNVPINAFSFDPISGLLTSNVVLAPGLNTFKIEATNPCGTITNSATVSFDNCVTPTVQLVIPSATGTTTSNANITIQAYLKNVLSNQNATLTQNGVVVTNFTFTNGQLVFPTTLINGINTFTIAASSSCGNATETFTINYQNCAAPIVSVTNPQNNSTVNSVALVFKARIDNIAGKQNVSLKLNGVDNGNFTYTAATKLIQSTLQLQAGMNVITLGAINNCGSDIETIYVNYDNCVAPIVSIANTATTVTNAAFVLNATLQNMLETQGISVTQNGNPVNFNYFNSQLTSALTLVQGNNTFVITATKSCGTATKTIVVNYNNCIAPIVFILNPTTSGSVVNATVFTFKATATNISTPQQIVLKQNNQIIPFIYNNGLIEANATLVNGVNNFQLIVTNACGSDTKSTAISFVSCTPPSISIINPVLNNTTINVSQFLFKASVSGSTNTQAITVKLNGQMATFNLNSGFLTANLNLTPGVNNIIISASNSCGTVIETSTITYDNCVQPTIQLNGISNTSQTVTNPNFTVSAAIVGIELASAISFTQNGQSKTFGFSNSNFTSNLQLVEGLNTITLTSTNSCGVAIKTLNITLNTCVPPIVSFTNPAISGTTVATAPYNFTANIQNIANAQGISLKQNGATISNFSFTNGQLSANLTLQVGLNTFIVVATNTCGIATEATSITFNNCVPPTVSFTNPANSGVTVSRPSFILEALVQNIQNANGISFTQNGVAITNFNLNNTLLSSIVNLQSGLNTFVIIATNGCGSATQTISVNYSDCITPVVSITTPVNSITSVVTAPYTFTASVQNITSAQGISLKLNGTTISNFSFNNGMIQANVNLQAGLNTFILTGTNACGTVADTKTITFNNCVPPVAVINSPSANGTTVATAPYTFTASVQNITSAQGISLKLNGTPISNFSFNNGMIQANVNLQAGLNTFILTGTNACGTVSDTRTINFICQLPTIVFNPTISRGSSYSYFFSATVTNVPSQQGINFTLNNSPVNDYTYQSGTIQTTLSLQNGSNTIRITASNPCGTVTRDTVINFGTCVAPMINFTSPNTIGTTVSSANFNLSANVENMTSAQGITLKLNNIVMSSLNYADGIIQKNVTLQPGLNTFLITAINNCGTSSETTSVTYTNCIPPTISFVKPATDASTVTNALYNFSAAIGNITNPQGINLKLNGVSVSANYANGLLQATVTLQEGTNTFTVSTTNECGNANLSRTLIYQNCVAPIITNTSTPASGGITPNLSVNVSAVIQNYTPETVVTVKVNGSIVTAYSNINGFITGILSLQNGMTTVEFSATNTCGTDTEVYTITRCKPTSLSLLNPSARNTTVSTPNQVVQFNVFNLDNQTSINVTQNGSPNNNFSLNGQQVVGNVQLVPGVNTFQVIVSNACNQLSESIIINYVVGTTPSSPENTSPNNPPNNDNRGEPTPENEGDGGTNPGQRANSGGGNATATPNRGDGKTNSGEKTPVSNGNATTPPRNPDPAPTVVKPATNATTPPRNPAPAPTVVKPATDKVKVEPKVVNPPAKDTKKEEEKEPKKEGPTGGTLQKTKVEIKPQVKGGGG